MRQPDTYYQRDFTPTELVGTCVNAAFAASLGVYGKATNGEVRLGYDAPDTALLEVARLRAKALATESLIAVRADVVSKLGGGCAVPESRNFSMMARSRPRADSTDGTYDR